MLHLAKVAWLTPGEMLRVEASLPGEPATTPFVWRDFEGHRYAHHEE